MNKTCVLDPEAKQTLKPQENFDYLIFGGILGDNPPQKRTGQTLTRFFSKAHKRNIGKKQFSTDNAVYVAHQIINRKKLKDMAFQDNVEIPINKIESVILPYRYPIVRGKPRIDSKLIKYLKNKKEF